MANVSFADGKLKICSRQVRRWPSAKFMSDKWQNKILPSANVKKTIGKFLFFKWENVRLLHLSAGGKGREEPRPNKLQRITTKKKTCVHSAENTPQGTCKEKQAYSRKLIKTNPRAAYASARPGAHRAKDVLINNRYTKERHFFIDRTHLLLLMRRDCYMC